MSSAVEEKRIGLLGYGVVGSKIAKDAIDGGYANIAFMHGRDLTKAPAVAPDAKFLADVNDVAMQDVDLVIEAANDVVVRATIRDVLKKPDMMIFTMTWLADDGLNEAVCATSLELGRDRFGDSYGAARAGERLRDCVGVVTTCRWPS